VRNACASCTDHVRSLVVLSRARCFLTREVIIGTAYTDTVNSLNEIINQINQSIAGRFTVKESRLETACVRIGIKCNPRSAVKVHGREPL
jgi:hypothetical protein